MAFPDPHSAALAARAGGAARHGRPNAEELRRQLAEHRIECAIRRIVDSAPPLTADQRARLAILLLRGEAA